jgi:tRNA A-37 threonylcarbamoyl transferase component Bud32
MPDRAAERLIADRYALETPIGQGGMGVVWGARDTLLGREVAIKEVRLPASIPDSERDSMRARVLREARAAARLNHPGAVTLYDVINEQGHAFIVMELIHAPTLAQTVATQGPLDPSRAAGIGLQVAAALAAAHQAGIVHRDVKPANVMVGDDGTARLTDFGIARVQGDPKLTSTGLIVGSPAYMAPEQASGEAAGPPADLWGLGATLYFAVEGRPPFERGGSIATMAAVVNDAPRPPQRAGTLGPVISSLLSKTPQARPTADELRERLEWMVAAQAGAPGARPPGAPPPASRPGPSRPGYPSPGPSRPGQPDRPVSGAAATLPGHPVADLAAEPADPTERQEGGQAASRPPGHTDHRRAGRRRLGAGAALVALVALVAVAFWLSGAFSADRDRGRSASSRGSGASVTTAPAASATTAPQAPSTRAGTGSTSPGAGAPGEIPPGWIGFRHRTGAYSLAYPSGWHISSSNGGDNDTDLRAPDGLLLRVQSSDQPRDPMQAWTELERSFASSHRRQGYRRIALEPGSYKGLDAAVWEFSYLQGGQRVRARDVTFKSADGRWGYAILLQAPERSWPEAQAVGAQFERAFTVLG